MIKHTCSNMTQGPQAGKSSLDAEVGKKALSAGPRKHSNCHLRMALVLWVVRCTLTRTRINRFVTEMESRAHLYAADKRVNNLFKQGYGLHSANFG